VQLWLCLTTLPWDANTQNISVNGARTTQNNFQINGVDANRLGVNAASTLAVPAPETIQEFKVQTSLYDATLDAPQAWRQYSGSYQKRGS